MGSIRQFQTFVAVASGGSFAAAAQQVSLTQAAVGLQMRGLEEALGRTLFDRNGKTIALNQAGRELLPRARHLVALYQQMQGGATTADAMAGSLHLGAVVSAVQPLLQATLALRQRHPALDLHVRAAKSADLLARVQATELDAALVVLQRSRGSGAAQMAWTPLYAEPMVLLVHADTPAASVRQLVEHQPFIRFDRTEHTGELVERALRRLRARPAPFLELNAIETMVDLVRARLGVTLLPRLRASQWHTDPSLRVLALPPPVEQREMALAYLQSTAKAVQIGAVLDALRIQIGSGAAMHLPPQYKP